MKGIRVASQPSFGNYLVQTSITKLTKNQTYPYWKDGGESRKTYTYQINNGIQQKVSLVFVKVNDM